MLLRRSVCLLIFSHALIATSCLSDEVASATTRTVDVESLPKACKVDLGKHHCGETIYATVVLRNRSDARLTLRAIAPDCGCLAVKPERRECHVGEELRIALELAPSKKIAKVRRSVRVLFEESNSPLVLNIDVQIVGPLHLVTSDFRIASTGELVEIRGQKNVPGLTISDWQSVRASFHVQGPFEQDGTSFRLSVKPLFSFGNASDLLRLTYQDDSAKETVVDLPIEFRVSSPIRFLPSTVALTREDSFWKARSRMILAPSPIPFDAGSMRFVAHRKDVELKADKCDVEVSRVSSVLSYVNIAVRDDAGDSMPERLSVQGADGDVLGTLYFTFQ